MSADFSIDLNTQAIIDKIKNVSEGGMKDLAEDITENAKDLSPVDTGTNKASITWDEQNGKYKVYTESGYGAFLELGTKKMNPQPYIFPSFEKSIKNLGKYLEGKV